MILKKIKKINYTSFINWYYLQQKYTILNNKYKVLFFSIFMHKKLTYYRYCKKKKYYIYTNGQLLGLRIRKVKFFKKSPKNISLTVNLISRKFKSKLNSIFFFFCKNLNYKNYLWIKKFLFLNKPTIHFFITSNSWNYINKKKKRIKRRIVKELFKTYTTH